MRFFTGQPVPWQNGMPQSMHRARLLLEHLVDQRLVDFVPVLDPLGNRAVRNLDPGELLEAYGISHESSSPLPEYFFGRRRAVAL